MKKLEKMDRELLQMIQERAQLSEQAARARMDAAEPLYDLQGERARIEKLVESSKGPLDKFCVRGVFRELFSGSRALVKPLRVAYLGPRYSYSHLAALECFGDSAELIPEATISAVFDAYNRAQVDYGLVPIENSTDGRVVDTLEMFVRLQSAQICGEVQLRIHHYLLGKCSPGDIQEVYSKPQALSQCRNWLAKHLSHARPVEMASTAAAARLAAEKPGAAAIASRQAGVHYGLNVVSENIEDNANNITRFAVIGSQPAERTGNDKTAAMFEIPHVPGALADAMAVFKRNEINLTWIESFPMADAENEYLFFVEMEGHPEDQEITKMTQALRRKTVRMEVLGAYAKTSPVD